MTPEEWANEIERRDEIIASQKHLYAELETACREKDERIKNAEYEIEYQRSQRNEMCDKREAIIKKQVDENARLREALTRIAQKPSLMGLGVQAAWNFYRIAEAALRAEEPLAAQSDDAAPPGAQT